MHLSCKFLENCINVNNYMIKSSVTVYDGQMNDIYIQLCDLNQNIRYIPQGTTSLTAKFFAINSVNNITVSATQPFADDKSIWKISLGNQLPRAGALTLILIENSIPRTFNIQNAVNVQMLNNGGC